MENAKILIVEDQKTTAKKIEKDLLKMGYTITSIASTGEEVIESIEKNRPDLVLMDIILEGKMDGIDASEQIQATFDIPVVFLTAYADTTKLKRATMTEPYGYLVKPFESKELRATIESAIYKHRSEKKLKESQMWLNTTLNSIGDGVITINLSGHVIFINKVAISLIKAESDYAIGKPLEDVFTMMDEQTGAKIEIPIQKIIDKGISTKISSNILANVKRNKITVEYSFEPIKDDKTNLIGFALVFRDVTKKISAEKRLQRYQNDLERMVKDRTLELEESNTKLTNEIVERKELEGRLRKLNLAVVQSPAMVLITDIKGNIEYVNPKFAKVTGYTPAEVIGKKPSVLISKHHTTDEYRQMWDRLQSGKEWHGEFYNKKKDDEYYWESATISPLRNEDGLITNYVKVAEDITSHKIAEEELIKSQCELENRVAERTEELSKANELLQQEIIKHKRADDKLQFTQFTVDNNSDIIYWVRSDGRITYANHAACAIMGYSREELNSMSVTDIASDLPENNWPSHFQELKNAGSKTFEALHKTKAGHIFPVEILTNYLTFAGNEYVCAYVRDITERVTINEQLKDSLKEKEALLQEVHHRVKNNMQMICSLINLRSKYLKDKECIEIFEDCVNRIKSMALIHENLYKSNDFAKINLAKYVKDISEELILFFGISQNRVKFSFDVDNISLGIDDAIPCGLIINELVSNTFKHAFPNGMNGEISIKIRLTNEDELELIFRDNGIGAPPNINFENIETLGLRLVNGIVTKQLRGKLKMNTQNGTEFCIIFKKHI